MRRDGRRLMAVLAGALITAVLPTPALATKAKSSAVLEVRERGASSAVPPNTAATGEITFVHEYESNGKLVECSVVGAAKLKTNLKATDSVSFGKSTTECNTPGYSITGAFKKMTFSANDDTTLTFKSKPVYSEPNGCKYELPASYPGGKLFMEFFVGYPGPSPVGSLATGSGCAATVSLPAEYTVGTGGGWQAFVEE